VVGLKPTYGRVSRYGLVAFASSLDQIGPLAADVADTAAVFDVIAGHDPADSTSIPEPSPDVSAVLGDGVEGLRVGVIAELLDAADADVVSRVRAAAEALEAAGAKVNEVRVPAARLGLSAYYLISAAEASSNLARFDGVRYGLRVDAPDVNAMYTATRAAGFGPEVKRRIMLGTYALSAGYYDAFYLKAQKVRTLIKRDFDQAFARCDAIVSATSPTVAFRLGEKTGDPLAMYLNDVLTLGGNLAGLAGVSVPCGNVDGLPVGLQVLAPQLGEAMAFRVARAYEVVSGVMPEVAPLA
jgi:aspartyl-tRNA(Asn)/glutamyl-tRNA(Gln) amidotransferase subunit A